MRARQRGLPRAFDVTVAVVILVLVAPVLAAVGIAIAVTSRGPVFFRHRRVGRGGRSFQMLKFRTMRAGQAGPNVTSKDDPRITPVGRVLRRTKLDELPELWNIVRGDMALVGPRPESTAYVDLADALWQDVLSVRPGVTDPMTLRLRNEEELLAAAGTDYETFYRHVLVPYKLRGYQAYLASRTWKTDLGVLGQTALAVSFPGSVPAPRLEEVAACQPGGVEASWSPDPLGALLERCAALVRSLRGRHVSE